MYNFKNYCFVKLKSKYLWVYEICIVYMIVL